MSTDKLKSVRDMTAAEIVDFEREHGIRPHAGRRGSEGAVKQYRDMTQAEREAWRRENGIRE